MLHYLSDKKLPYIICGDININRLQHTSSSSVNKYIEIYESYNCQQIITRPTRVTATSASLIDHFYATFDLEKVIPGILINDLSDHLPIFLLIKTNTAEIHDKKPVIKRDFTNFDSEMFLETNVPWEMFLETMILKCSLRRDFTNFDSEMCLETRGRASNATIQPLIKLQNKAIKIINPTNMGSLEDHFQHLNILCLPKLYRFSVGNLCTLQTASKSFWWIFCST